MKLHTVIIADNSHSLLFFLPLSVMEQVKDKDPNGLCCLLQELVPDVDSEVFENIKRHKITGDIFLQLDEEYLREIAPSLGDRIRLKK